MPASPVYVTRLVKLPLIDADGAPIGGIDDAVLVPSGTAPPRVLGLVATVQRRHIFINIARIGEIDPIGVRLRSGTINVRPFRQRPGEKLVMADLLQTRIGEDFITDVALELDGGHGVWRATTVALGGRGPLRRRRSPGVVPWTEVASQFDAGPDYAEVAELREMHPSEVAREVQDRPLAERRRLAELMEDDSLADLLEELDEDDQVRLVQGMDLNRLARVVEQMEPDDAADLLGELPEDDRHQLLGAMDPEESTGLRRLLAYDDDTAGGLMTPEPVIMALTATVAEALAVVRDPELPMELAAQVFVVRPPTSTPTGTFLGSAPFQRLLREPPGTLLEHCIVTDEGSVPPELAGKEVAERLASYDALAVPVCDAAGRLIGAVTIDDVLDHVLPEGWRRAPR